MPYQRVLTGTDGSATAAIAESVSTSIAERTNAELILVSASQGADAEEILERSRLRAAQRLPAVKTIAAPGAPAEKLVEVCREQQADLVVVGNKGMQGLRRFVLSSVPDRLSHEAPADLLIVNTAQTRARRGTPYAKVLIASDGSETAQHAVAKGLSLSSLIEAQPTLFYAGHPATAEIVFKEVENALTSEFTYSTASAPGDPADATCEAAESGEFDLIVVGNKGMTEGNLRLGSIPNAISHHAPCDVLIVKTVNHSIEELRVGEGALILMGKDKVAVFKDENEVVQLSPRCMHMGCTVGWNAIARTWDCPCHGSRYNARGEVIQGPAAHNLEPYVRQS